MRSKSKTKVEQTETTEGLVSDDSTQAFGSFVRIIEALSNKDGERLTGDVDQVVRLLLAYQDTPISDSERRRRFLYNLIYLISSLSILATSIFLFSSNMTVGGSVFFLLGAAGFWMCGREGLGKKPATFGTDKVKEIFSPILDKNISAEENEV